MQTPDSAAEGTDLGVRWDGIQCWRNCEWYCQHKGRYAAAAMFCSL